MPSRPIPADLLHWALNSLGRVDATENSAPGFTMIAGDASNRRYFRLVLGPHTYMIAEAPPDTEKNPEFIEIQSLLASAGVRVPELYAVDMERGYLLLEDLGDRVLWPHLTPGSVDRHYGRAFEVLHKMAAVDMTARPTPAYDRDLLTEELSRFDLWFVESLLGYTPNDSERELIARFGNLLIESALEQPKVLVHRDFHSRNLMLLDESELAVIDFQDAVLGPVTYDLASLLKDCYISWPAEQVSQWVLRYKNECSSRETLAVTDSQFLRWFDWMGLQRHIKVLGTFARLYLRDGKSGYLDDLPLVIHYVEQTLGQYAGEEPVFAEFQNWFAGTLSPRITQQPWSKKQ